MVVHMDDHLVHRGHAVFDTAIIVDGFLYQLAEHLLRFQTSAEAAGLDLPCSIEQIHRIICETAAASTQINGEPPGMHSLLFAFEPLQALYTLLASSTVSIMWCVHGVMLFQHLLSVCSWSQPSTAC